MTGNYKKVIGAVATLAFATFAINGCDNNTGSSGTNNPNSGDLNSAKMEANSQTTDMNIQWSLDSSPISYGQNMSDIAWHLMTVTATGMAAPLESGIAVKGIQYKIDPAPTDGRGEKIEMEDINCNTAVFSKNGDSCSVYVRISYDTATGTSNPPTIPAKFALKAPEISLMEAIYVKPLFNNALGDYRAVEPIETRYYQGANLASNPIQYRILSMQNVSMPPLTITKVTDLTNPTFTLMNRTTAESNDPYYGAYSQCSLAANESIKKVNYLPELGSECILVYQAASMSSQESQVDSVTLETDAGSTSPWTKNTLKLVANYAAGGTPIPETVTPGSNFLLRSGTATVSGTSMVMNSDGTLSSGTISPSTDPFNLVNLSYNFTPNRIQPAPYFDADTYPVPYYQNGVINIENQSGWATGSQVITDMSTTNPVTVGYAMQKVTPNSSAHGYANTQACDGTASSEGWVNTESNGWINSMDEINATFRHEFRLTMVNKSNGHCGGADTQNLDMFISMDESLNNKRVYYMDDGGCGGKTWDEGGWVDLSGSCVGQNCSYVVAVSAHHGGSGCQGTNTEHYTLAFRRPEVYMELSQLSNFNLKGGVSLTSPGVIGKFTQNLSAMIGTASGAVAQAVECGYSAKECRASGLYSNGLSATSMSYDIGLKAGDTLIQGIADFTRSEGYTLSDFTITH